jgi:prophage tail gpP-like protein
MPNPALIATVVAGGQTYSAWESIEIERRYDDVISHMRLTVAEFINGPYSNIATRLLGTTPGTWSSVQLMPGTPAQGYLAGQLAITGQVCVRQAAYDKESHGVQIVVASSTQPLIPSTVDNNPGQYSNQTWQQLASAVAGKVGVNVKLLSGTDKVFPRVSETPGETRLQFIERLARMRNLYLRDDQSGNLIATQGVGSTAPTALVEGGNIKKAQIVFRNDEYGNPAKTILANIGGSSTGTGMGPARDIIATVTSPNMPTNTPQTVPGEEPGDQIDAQMRAARQAAWNLATYINGSITVFGWLLSDASLWINQVGNLVPIYSPMLAPVQPLILAIKGVVHRQSNQEGTETVIEVCDPGALGALNKGQSLGSAPSPAQTANTGAGISSPSGARG